MRKAMMLAVVTGGLVLAALLFLGKGHTEPYEHSLLNSFFLLVHILGGSLGVLVAPLLFLKNSTNRKLFRIHAPLGKLYVGAIAAACEQPPATSAGASGNGSGRYRGSWKGTPTC